MNSSTRSAAPATRFARLADLLKTASFRLTLFHAALFMAAGLVLFGIVYWAATDFAAADDEKEIELEYLAIDAEMRLVGEERLPDIVANHLAQREDVRAVYLLQDRAGNKLVGNIGPRSPVLGPLTVK